MKKADLNKEGLIEVRFPYDPALVRKVKSIAVPKNPWNPVGKYWLVANRKSNVDKLREWGFEIHHDILAKQKKREEFLRKEISIPGLKQELYPFQKEGVKFVDSCNGRALVADSMGLGKTVQALAWWQLHRNEIGPAIIVCPASLKYNWRREARKWLPDIDVEVLSGRSPSKSGKTFLENADIIIINYDILNNWVSELNRINPGLLVLDESHYIKNKKAKRTKAVQLFTKGVKHVICLTGTPIINRPVEFYNSLAILAPREWPSFWRYAQRYCAARHNGFGWDFSGASNTGELHEKLVDSVMIRRTKKDVLKDLPVKTRVVVPLEIRSRKEYQEAYDDFLNWMDENEEANAIHLTKIEKLKQVAAYGKLESVAEWVQQFIDADEKLVLFAVHHLVIDWLMKKFNKIAVKLDGRDSAEAKQKATDKFQRDKSTKLMVANLKAGGVGWTWTAASNVAFCELAWSPGEMDQAEDRIHRIGQENACTAWYLVAEGTIEEEIVSLIDKKREILAQVLDGQKDVDESSLLGELLNKIRKGGKS